jgi:hypothetical protein
MAITTYAELKTAIANWIARDDLTSYLDEFIDLTETMLKREPAPPESLDMGGIRADIQRTTGTLSTSAATLALPSDFLEMYRFTLTADANYTVLRFVDRNMLNLMHRDGSGLPAFFTISDVFEFDVKPDSAYAYELSYWPSVTALSASNTTNWVITNYPDVYLAGCMFHAARFIKDEREANTWLNQYKVATWSASETYRQGRYSQGSINIKTDTVTP